MSTTNANSVWSGYFGRWISGLQVPVNGFDWITGEGWDYQDEHYSALTVPQRGPWLVPRDGLNPVTRTIEVLNHPHRVENPDLLQVALHRRFARLANKREPSRQNAVRTFADRYGFIGRRRETLIRLEPRPTFAPGDLWRAEGETYARWLEGVFGIAAAVALWDHVQNGDSKTLDALFHWADPATADIRCVYREGRLSTFGEYQGDDWHHGAGRIEQRVRLNDIDSRPEIGGDPIEAAREVLSNVLMGALDGQVTPYVSRHADGEFWYIPRTLQAALYLHLHREISGKSRQPILCPHCDRFYVPTHGLQKYCSPQCRKLAHYYRRSRPRS